MVVLNVCDCNPEFDAALSVGARNAANIMNRIARLDHSNKGELTLALEYLSRAILRSRADLKVLASSFHSIDARLGAS
jgi:hypothetical protein